jgi:predicted Rossmann fold flavoprotein
MDLLVIGGGAAGLAAAVAAARRGARVTILERANRIGKKLLATGNGRCNLANTGAPTYYGHRDFALAVLRHTPVSGVLDFFHGIGLATVQEEDRVYPACGQASAVLDVLNLQLERLGVDIILNETAVRLDKQEDAFICHTLSGRVIKARHVLVAGGGMAAPKLGSNGSAYSLLTGLGHPIIEPAPALTQLEAALPAISGLAGLRMPALLTLYEGGNPMAAAQGEVLFTDYGISGVCAMQLSRDAQNAVKQGLKPRLYIDLSPLLHVMPIKYERCDPKDSNTHVPAVLALLEERLATLGMPLNQLLTGIVPRLFAHKIGAVSLSAMAGLLAAYPVDITGVRGFEWAQVTQGGIDPDGFDPRTMQSRLTPGLYAAGEVLDVDGDCGGFNLMFAFAGGISAGNQMIPQ